MVCRNRFTTYETLETSNLTVIKKDGRREEFSREKLIHGIEEAAKKRPVRGEIIEHLVDSISGELAASLVREVPFQVIGEMVLEKLISIDKIAYVRYASVYRNFKEPRDFLLELEHLFNLPEQTVMDKAPFGEEK